jgi:hypothetical protein
MNSDAQVKTGPSWIDFESRRNAIRDQYEKIAHVRERWILKNRYFYDSLGAFLSFIVEPQKSVVLFRSELGQLMNILAPSRAIGVDISQKMVDIASEKYPQFKFICDVPESVDLPEKYDYLIFHTLGEVIDIEKALINAGRYATADSRIVIINYNYLWRPFIILAEKTGMKVPQPVQNWLNVPTIGNILELAGCEMIKRYDQILMPVRIPLVSWFFNRVLAKIPLIKKLCFVQIIVARKRVSGPGNTLPTVSVIVPCKNEKGNIEDAANRIPEMGSGTEIIFSDDKSTDGTAEEITRVIARYPEKNIKLFHGPGINKAKNVWSAFDGASGEVLMILDADLTVLPEELPYFYDALVKGHGEFINGSRMVYPMEKDAMRLFNIVGNRFFSICFSYILGQRISDTLCGTKVFFRRDWARVKGLVGTWGIDDRWGDYDLLFGAAKLHLKIVEVPVHYVERVYGETKMKKRLLHGLVMLRMCLAALKRFRFV